MKFQPGDKVVHERRGIGIVIDDDAITASMEESMSMDYNRVSFGIRESKKRGKKKEEIEDGVIIPSYKLKRVTK